MKHNLLAIVVLISTFAGDNAFVPRCSNLIQIRAPRKASSSFPSESFTSSASRHAHNAVHPTLFARRQILSEDDLAAPPDQKIIEAVEKLGGNDVLASGK